MGDGEYIEKENKTIDTHIESSRPRITPFRRKEEVKKKDRSPAPASSEEDRELPAYLRKKGIHSEENTELTQSTKAHVAGGEAEFIFEDDDEFEIPSFIRKQVD